MIVSLETSTCSNTIDSEHIPRGGAGGRMPYGGLLFYSEGMIYAYSATTVTLIDYDFASLIALLTNKSATPAIFPTWGWPTC